MSGKADKKSKDIVFINLEIEGPSRGKRGFRRKVPGGVDKVSQVQGICVFLAGGWHMHFG